MTTPTTTIDSKLKDLFLFGLVLLIALFSWPRMLPLMVNADSYAILLGSDFIAQTGSLTSRLGEYGDWFSPLFYRGGFSVVIYLVSLGGYFNYYFIAQILVQLSYVGIVACVFWFGRRVFNSSLAGFFAASLIALSFSFNAWSQVIMSEIPTIFLIVLSLTILAYRNRSLVWYLMAALLFGVALTFRFEMVIVLLAGLIWIYQLNRKMLIRTFIFALTAGVVWLAYVGWLYFSSPFPDSWLNSEMAVLTETLTHHHFFVYAFLAGLVIVPLVIRWPILLLPLSLAAWPASRFFDLDLAVAENYPPLVLFFKHEMLIIVAGLLAVPLLVKKYSNLIKFLLSAVILLAILYFSRGEYRYYVHLLLFLSIPAGYFLAVALGYIVKIIQNKFLMPLIAFIFIGSIFFIQSVLFVQPGFLPETSYEQKVIDLTAQVIEANDLGHRDIIICSVYSEAMYYSTGMSSQDCFNGTHDLSRNYGHPILIVVGEDMSRHQAAFVQQLETFYQSQKIDERWIVTRYQEKNTSSLPLFPLRWFLIE